MLLYLILTYLFFYAVSYQGGRNCLRISASPSTYVSIKYVQKYVYYTNFLVKVGYVRFENRFGNPKIDFKHIGTE